MSNPYMPFYVGDYLRDTRTLTLEEHGAYLLLIMEYWARGSLPKSDRKLAQILGIGPRKFKLLEPALRQFFSSDWTHKRIDAELAKCVEKSEKRSEAANKRWSKNAMQLHMQMQCKSNANADAKHMQPEPEPEPIDNIVTNKRAKRAVAVEETKSELLTVLTPELADALIAHRKAKKAPLTPMAAKLLVKSFIEFGNPTIAVEAMIANGWQGFKPAWMSNARGQPSNQGGQDWLADQYWKIKSSEFENEDSEGAGEETGIIDGDYKLISNG